MFFPVYFCTLVLREYNRIRFNYGMDYLKDNEILMRYGLASMSLEPGEPLMMDAVFGNCDCEPFTVGTTSRQWELVFRVDDERYERLVSALRWSEEMTGAAANAPSGPIRKMRAYWPPEIDPADFEWELVTPHGRYKIKHR